MLALIIYVLLFNLNYILAQGSLEETIFHDSYAYKSVDSKPKNISTNEVQSSPKISEQHIIRAPVPFSIKLKSNPFLGKDDHIINHRQLGNGNQAVSDQNDKKLNNEIDNRVPPPNTNKSIKSDKKEPPVLGATSNSSNPLKQVKTNVTSSANTILEKGSTLNPVRTNPKEDVMQSGALLRGFYVFLGLSVLIMMYFIFRSYRLRHGSQPSTTVRKYGVTARRSDMEMRPLELDDDDDDTVFEINNQNINR